VQKTPRLLNQSLSWY